MSETTKPTEHERSARAVQRFFMAVGRAHSAWRDENTLPIFPLLLIVDAEMLEADARYEARELVP